MHNMQECEYTVQELVHDATFRRFVNGTAPSAEAQRWNKWMERSEVNRIIARDAITEIAGFDFKNIEEVSTAHEWNRLKKSINRSQKRSSFKRTSGFNSKWIYRVAAVIIIGIFARSGYYFLSQSVSGIAQEKRILRTATNERETIRFPEGAKIVLDGNSKLSYNAEQKLGDAIDVTLEGQAYFSSGSARRKSMPVFKVHTPDGVIEDIGTKFLVKTSSRQSRVVLQQGSVQVRARQKNQPSKLIKLNPNEMLLFGADGVTRKKVNATFYTSWATGFMQFDHTSIGQFAEYVKQRYNVEVKILDPALSNIKLDGSIYYRSLSGLVRSVSKVAKVSAYQSKDGKIVYIGKQL